jgi:hypothetical protein
MHGDLDCEHVHELVDGWPAELTNVILKRGGHLLWGGLTLSKLSPWLPVHCTDGTFSQTRSHDLALHTVCNTLEKLKTASMEKRSILPVLDGVASDLAVQITPIHNGAPFDLCSRSGVKVKDVKHMVIGSGAAYYDGNSWDTGELITLLNGVVLKNKCLIRATCS